MRGFMSGAGVTESRASSNETRQHILSFKTPTLAALEQMRAKLNELIIALRR
jgi:hypothetical protein